MKTTEQWDNTKMKMVSSLEISRIDVALLTLDVGEEFFFNNEWGANMMIGSCTKGDQQFSPNWGGTNRRLAEDTRLQAGLRLSAASPVDLQRRTLASSSVDWRRLDEDPTCVQDCKMSLQRAPETCTDVEDVARCVLNGAGDLSGCGAGTDNDNFLASDDYVLYHGCLCDGVCPTSEASTCVEDCKSSLVDPPGHAPRSCGDVETIVDCVSSGCSQDENDSFLASNDYLNYDGCLCDENQASCDIMSGTSEDLIMACAMTSSCWGQPDFSQGPTCDWLTSMQTCRTGFSCSDDEVLKQTNELLNAWYTCICQGSCDKLDSDAPSPAPGDGGGPAAPVFLPADYLNNDEKWGGQDLNAG